MVSRFAAALNVDAVKLDPWFHTDDLLNDLLNKLISNVNIDSDSICEDPFSLDMLEEILNSPDMDESPTFAI